MKNLEISRTVQFVLGMIIGALIYLFTKNYYLVLATILIAGITEKCYTAYTATNSRQGAKNSKNIML